MHGDLARALRDDAAGVDRDAGAAFGGEHDALGRGPVDVRGLALDVDEPLRGYLHRPGLRLHVDVALGRDHREALACSAFTWAYCSSEHADRLARVQPRLPANSVMRVLP